MKTNIETGLKEKEVLERIKENKKSIIVTNLMGYLRYLPSIKATSFRWISNFL